MYGPFGRAHEVEWVNHGAWKTPGVAGVLAALLVLGAGCELAPLACLHHCDPPASDRPFPRFHPVPTRPVFSPSGVDPLPMPDGPCPLPDGPSETGATNHNPREAPGGTEQQQEKGRTRSQPANLPALPLLPSGRSRLPSGASNRLGTAREETIRQPEPGDTPSSASRARSAGQSWIFRPAVVQEIEPRLDSVDPSRSSKREYSR